MAQENERLLILDLLEKGKINGDEADKLLVSLRSSDHTEIPVELESETSDVQKRAHWIRIKVTELSTGKRRFSMILPLFFIRLGILFSGRWGNIDLDRGSLEMGKEFFRKPVKGKIVDASDPEDDEHVEISFL